MKRILPALLCLLLLNSFSSGAQEVKVPLNEPDYNKSPLFADLPPRIVLNNTELESLVQSPIGAAVRVSLGEGLLIEGTVVSRSANDKQFSSVVIRCSNRTGATLTVSKISPAEGASYFRGRILSRNNGDAFEMQQSGDQYLFVKRGYYDLVSE